MFKIKDNVDLKELRNNLDNLIKDLNLIIEYADGEDSSRYDKLYGECAKNILKLMEEVGLVDKVICDD